MKKPVFLQFCPPNHAEKHIYLEEVVVNGVPKALS